MWINKFLTALSRLAFQISRFSYKKSHYSSLIFSPEYIVGKKYIEVSPSVYIGRWASIIVEKNDVTPELVIGKGVKIRRFSHIVCISKVVIGEDALIADKVFISDNIHTYKNTNSPIINQGLSHVGDVSIGEGACIGENVSIIGASVGKNSVVGANSVVVNDIPDYSVAVGSPAKVIKTYDKKSSKWVRV